jgi:hypothetical protein
MFHAMSTLGSLHLILVPLNTNTTIKDKAALLSEYKISSSVSLCSTVNFILPFSVVDLLSINQ